MTGDSSGTRSSQRGRGDCNGGSRRIGDGLHRAGDCDRYVRCGRVCCTQPKYFGSAEGCNGSCRDGANSRNDASRQDGVSRSDGVSRLACGCDYHDAVITTTL